MRAEGRQTTDDGRQSDECEAAGVNEKDDGRQTTDDRVTNERLLESMISMLDDRRNTDEGMRNCKRHLVKAFLFYESAFESLNHDDEFFHSLIFFLKYIPIDIRSVSCKKESVDNF